MYSIWLIRLTDRPQLLIPHFMSEFYKLLQYSAINQDLLFQQYTYKTFYENIKYGA